MVTRPFTATTQGNTSVTTATIVDPSGGTMQADDVVIVALMHRRDRTVTTPSGWSLLGPISAGGVDVDGTDLELYWRRGQPSTWDFTFSVATSSWYSFCDIIRGCRTSANPWMETLTSSVTATAGIPVPAASNLLDDSLVFAFLAHRDSTGPRPSTFGTAPTPYTKEFEFTEPVTTGNGLAVLVATGNNIASGTATQDVAPPSAVCRLIVFSDPPTDPPNIPILNMGQHTKSAGMAFRRDRVQGQGGDADNWAGTESYMISLFVATAQAIVGVLTGFWGLAVSIVAGVSFSELFTASNGSTWGSDWTLTPNGGTIDIQSNRGRMVTPATAFFETNAELTGHPVANFDLYVDLLIDANTFTFPIIFYRMNTVGAGSDDYYRVAYAVQSDTFYIEKYIGFTLSSTPGSVTKTTVPGDTLRIRIQANGNNHKGKAWILPASEPGTWDWEFTDSFNATETRISLGHQTGSALANRCDWDNFTIVDL